MAFEKDQAKAREKASQVKLFAHDIHGVLTPNTFYCDVEGRRRFGFWHMDGFGDLSLNFNGIKVIFLDTTSVGEEGYFRAKELKLDKGYFKVTDKVAKLAELRQEYDLSEAQTAYVGCEITDLAAMQGHLVSDSDITADHQRRAAWHVLAVMAVM